MARTPKTPATEQNNVTPSNTAQFEVLAQYIKDCSFENPRVPQAFQEQLQPQMNIRVDVRAERLNDEGFETVLRVDLQAKVGENDLFALDLTYGGVFGMRGIPEEHVRPLLLIEGARLLFPFVREIVADLTRNGGFAPLLLQPIDFAALFQQQQKPVSEGSTAVN
jgi:preprotein translocase subunit SecB